MLLELQKPELEAFTQSQKQSKSPVLLPFEVMMQPLELRFRYHFDGDRPTNKINKPEYFFSHAAELITKYDDFVARNVQPVLSNYFRGTQLASCMTYIDATSALITALLPMLRNKVFALLPKVAGQAPLLSHLMHEIMSFDTQLREEWNYDGGCGARGWKGLAWEVLAEGDWFGRWLKVEKDCTCSELWFSDTINICMNSSVSTDSDSRTHSIRRNHRHARQRTARL